MSNMKPRQPSLTGSFDSSLSATSFSLWETTSTPPTSPPASIRQRLQRSASDSTTVLNLTAPVQLAFTKGSKLFKIRYTKIEVCHDGSGNLRCIELTDPSMVSNHFVHTFPNSRRPVPHLEKPATSTETSLRVSFLEEQNVQVAQTIFTSQPRYTFGNASDCSRFQEAVLGHTLLSVAGVAEIMSKGRGEEAISQNVRLWKLKTGSLNLLYFANSQRNNQKRYTNIPVNSVHSVELPKKAGKPVSLKLEADGELCVSLKTLSISFLDHTDALRFCALLQANGVPLTKH